MKAIRVEMTQQGQRREELGEGVDRGKWVDMTDGEERKDLKLKRRGKEEEMTGAERYH